MEGKEKSNTILVEMKFAFGDIVYEKTDTEGKPMMVTQLLLMPNGVKYGCSSDSFFEWFYDFQLSEVKNM